MGRPRLQYLKQVARNIEAEGYTTMERIACKKSRWKAANQSKNWRRRRRRKKKKKKNHTDSRKTTIQNVRRVKILIRCCILLWVVRCLNTKSASFVYQRETWFLSLIYIVVNKASYHSSTHIHVTVLALPDEEFIVSSKRAPWDGPKLNSFFSFIGVWVTLEVMLRPCWSPGWVMGSMFWRGWRWCIWPARHRLGILVLCRECS